MTDPQAFETMTTEQLQELFAAGAPVEPSLEVAAPPMPTAATNKGGGKVK